MRQYPGKRALSGGIVSARHTDHAINPDEAAVVCGIFHMYFGRAWLSFDCQNAQWGFDQGSSCLVIAVLCRQNAFPSPWPQVVQEWTVGDVT